MSASLFGMQIEKHLWMTKPQSLVQQYVSQAYQTLQTIIKLINLYKPWKTARLSSFHKPPLQSVSILFKFVRLCFLFIAGSIPWDKGEPRGWGGGGGVGDWPSPKFFFLPWILPFFYICSHVCTLFPFHVLCSYFYVSLPPEFGGRFQCLNSW